MIEIAPHRPEWAQEFRAIGRTIRAALGERALRIDHIGSTSVPGLCAKDVIDVQITVASLSPDVTERMTALGYVASAVALRDHRPPGDSSPEEDWAKRFFHRPAGERRVHAHVRVAGRANQRYALLFRDYLIAHPETAAAYGELKRRLAAALARPDDYPEVKDPAVDLIYFAARDWAERGRWRLGPSDA